VPNPPEDKDFYGVAVSHRNGPQFTYAQMQAGRGSASRTSGEVGRWFGIRSNVLEDSLTTPIPALCNGYTTELAAAPRDGSVQALAGVHTWLGRSPVL
jgi:hypothetical protein